MTDEGNGGAVMWVSYCAPATDKLVSLAGHGRICSAAGPAMKLFLCGDVMTGRGIDQILAHPSDPVLYEGYASSAVDYVSLAETANGPIPRSVAPEYIWGDALPLLQHESVDARIINLETAVTRSDEWLPKGINYRMNPANIACLTVTRTDCCGLANNHVLDWGERGLVETLDALHAAGLRTAGAGMNCAAAEAPAVVPLRNRKRLLVYALGSADSGIPGDWAAAANRPGVAFLPHPSVEHAARLGDHIRAMKRDGDFVVASVHWGANWGYEIERREIEFAHALIDRDGVDLFHGHSSHHPKAIEVYRSKVILWGCGDFINDYEGISGNESFRPDLGVMYLPSIGEATGALEHLELVVLRRECFRLKFAGPEDTLWLCSALDRESRRFGLSVKLEAQSRLTVRW
jgi:poly-gamma-glutamate synthesis protein (capsule biosynthesis protein)